MSQLRECVIGIGGESRDAAKHPSTKDPHRESSAQILICALQVDKLRSRHAFISGPLWFIRSSDHLVWIRSSDPEIPGNN